VRYQEKIKDYRGRNMKVNFGNRRILLFFCFVIFVMFGQLCVAKTNNSGGIGVSIYKNSQNIIYGYIISGHSGYAKRGSDIICAGVSAISLNIINSIKEFTKDKTELKMNEADGYISFFLPELQKGNGSKEAIVLLKSLMLGMESISESYGERYVRVEVVQK
jgi:uncharacterized protein YsxB (DUF464 family)